MYWFLVTLAALLGVAALKQPTPSVVPPRPVVAQPVIPDGYRRMTDKEVTPELGELAKTFLKLPYGSVEPVENDAGLDVLAVLELHFHPLDGDVSPHGWHKGVSLYIRDDG